MNTVNSLFKNAHTDGTLSTQSLQALTNVDIGAQIQAGLGISADLVTASEVVLVSMLIDDSGSISMSNNAQTVRDGHNLIIESLLASKQSGNILAHTCYLNGHVLFPYQPLGVIDDDEKKRSGKVKYIQNPLVVKMNKGNYDPCLGTPLYDETVVLLGRVLAKYQEFADSGVVARTVTLIITDGADAHSTKSRVAQVKSLVTDLVGEHHIVAAMGIDGGGVDFRDIFKKMGIPDNWVLVPGNTQSEIRRAFQMFSQSAVRASQSPQMFQSTAVGGFANP